MPNRYIREAAIRSKGVNQLSWQAEVFWRRLLNVVDDFGRHHADPELLRADVFPRQLEKVRVTDIERLLAECEKAVLLFRYEADSKPFLVMNQWEQGRAKKSRYPDPPPDICKHLLTHSYDGIPMSPSPTQTPTPDSDSNKIEVLDASKGGAGGVASRHGQSGEPPRAAVETGTGGSEQNARGGSPPPLTGAMLTVKSLDAIARRIWANDDGWHYDNCKVDKNSLQLGSLKTALIPFLDKISDRTALAAWIDAAILAHQAVVDKLPIDGTPEAYAVGIWKLNLKKAVK